MANEQLTEWLRERGVEEEAVQAIIQTADRVEKLYRRSAEIGAAMDHESWLDEISPNERGSNMNQVVWFLLGLAGAPLAFLELSEEQG